MVRTQNVCKDMVFAWRLLVDGGVNPLGIDFEKESNGEVFVKCLGLRASLGKSAMTEMQLADGRDAFLDVPTETVLQWKRLASSSGSVYVGVIQTFLDEANRLRLS